MRVTQRMIFDNAVRDMTDSRSAYYDSLQKSSSGKQFRWASDNPSHAVAALSIRSAIEKGEAYIDTANSTDLWMSETANAMQAMEDLAKRAINLVLDGSSDTMGEDQRETLASETNMILNQAVGIGNTRHQGQHYIFAGFQTNTKPFTLDTLPTTPPTDVVTYHGDSGEIKRNIGPELPVTANLAGSTVFMGSGTDFFAALIRARDALNNNDKTEMEAGLKDIRAALDYMSNRHVEYGARQRDLNESIDRMEKSKIDMLSLLSQKEDIDMAEAVSTLQLQETVYQTVLQVSNRALATMNLFDYLG